MKKSQSTSKLVVKKTMQLHQKRSSNDSTALKQQQKRMRDLITRQSVANSDRYPKRNVNADLDEPSLLPKVKSTNMSNPKFVSKSRLILGTNKYIGGTYRNTDLRQQEINQSKSSRDLVGRASFSRNSIAGND